MAVQIHYTHAQLITLWEQAGGPGFLADTAAAIAQAESGGCLYAKAGPNDDRPVKTCTYRKTSGENSYGLWQINRQAHPQYSAKTLYTAIGNARAAVQIQATGGGFGAWSTYTNGAYKAYLTGVPVAPPGTVGVPGTTAPDYGKTSPKAWHHLSVTLGGSLQHSLAQSQKARLAALRALR